MLTLWRSTFWRIYFRLRGARVGRHLRVCGPLKVLLRDRASCRNIHIGDNVTFGGRTYIRLRRGGRLTIDSGVTTGTEVWLVGANDHTLSIGEGATLGSYSIFNGGHGLHIGAHCVLAAFVYVNTSDHRCNRGELIKNQGFTGRPVFIGEDVWLGGHVFVGRGVTVGQGAVVGAGAVVVRDIPPYSIAAGNPARVIKERPAGGPTDTTSPRDGSRTPRLAISGG